MRQRCHASVCSAASDSPITQKEEEEMEESHSYCLLLPDVNICTLVVRIFFFKERKKTVQRCRSKRTEPVWGWVRSQGIFWSNVEHCVIKDLNFAFTNRDGDDHSTSVNVSSKMKTDPIKVCFRSASSHCLVCFLTHGFRYMLLMFADTFNTGCTPQTRQPAIHQPEGALYHIKLHLWSTSNAPRQTETGKQLWCAKIKRVVFVTKTVWGPKLMCSKLILDQEEINHLQQRPRLPDWQCCHGNKIC